MENVVDYTDPNKHYPKDPFGLPCIDEVVISMAGCELFSLSTITLVIIRLLSTMRNR
jgi:hypothetical protein